jgi:hypothetical protein
VPPLNFAVRRHVKRALEFLRVVPLILVGAPSALSAEESVHAYLVAPSRLEAAKQSVEVLFKRLPEAKARWASIKARRVTYTVMQSSHGPFVAPCHAVPVTMVVTPTTVISSTYSETHGSCKKGAAVRPGERMFPLPTPVNLFSLVEEDAHLSPDCLSVTFNAELGIPEMIHAHCPDAFDDWQTTLVSKIEVVQ